MKVKIVTMSQLLADAHSKFVPLVNRECGYNRTVNICINHF